MANDTYQVGDKVIVSHSILNMGTPTAMESPGVVTVVNADGTYQVDINWFLITVPATELRHA